MSRILLLRPPSVFSKSNLGVPVTMPLSIAYLAGSLRQAGHNVQVIDGLGEAVHHFGASYGSKARFRGLSNQAILERIKPGVDAVGVTTMFSQDWPHIEDLINDIRGHFPGLPIIVGGEHATAASEYTLSSCPAVDCVALGEGEETIVDFAEHLAGRKALDQIPGLHYRGSGGRLVKNPPRARILSADQIPWPAWDLFDLNPYFETGEGHGVERGRSMPLVATRGCPYQCTFCSSPSMWTTRYVMRDAVKVVDEIEHYASAYRAENIDFYDLTAIIKKDWILAFCAELRRRRLGVSWQLPTGTRSEALDEEVLESMAAAGCMNVSYAPESGSERTLREIKKKVNLARLLDSARRAKRRGIFVKCNMMIGFPRETRADAWKTLWTAVKLAWMGVDDAPLYAYSPYPGSELYGYLRSTGAIPEMSRSYFESLMMFADLATPVTYCENIGPWEIVFYRIAGMSLFYGLSYVLHPSRLPRGWRNFRQRRSDTVFEERLFGLLRRLAQGRRRAV